MIPEVKWLLTAWAVIMVGIGIGQMYETKTKADCRSSLAQSNRTVDEIVQICGK
jgi:hypothetical protein